MKKTLIVFLGLVALACNETAAGDEIRQRHRLHLKGWGPVLLGMTADEVSAAAGLRLVLPEPEEGSDCSMGRFEEKEPKLALLFLRENGETRLERIYVDDPNITTKSGIRIGSTEAETKQAYGAKLEIEPHKYDLNGHYLTFVPQDAADAEYRVVFETDGEKVILMSAGRIPAVFWVEGCS